MRSYDEEPRRILLLCDDRRGHAQTVLDHIAALKELSGHSVFAFNPRGLRRAHLLDLDGFDAVVIHYSIVVISDHYLAPGFREKIRRFRGLKVQFVQDDYRQIDEMTEMMRYLGISVLFTLVPASKISRVWTEDRLPGVLKINTLAGYVSAEMERAAGPPVGARVIDLGYRGRTLPFWLGELGQEKVRIGQGVLVRAAKYGLKCDIAWGEGDRVYGKQWTRFIGSCKAMLGTESGSSIVDFDGSVERNVRRYLGRNPSADFVEVQRSVLASHEDNVRINVISPRMFETAALRTALVLFPGEYSKVIEPDRHYIPLAKDFANLDEVVRKLRDRALLTELTERAHGDLIRSGRYSYRILAREFDEMVWRRSVPGLERRRVWALTGGPVSAAKRRLARPVARLGEVRWGWIPWLLRAKAYTAARRTALAWMATREGLAVGAHTRLLAGCAYTRGRRAGIEPARVLADVLRLGVIRAAQGGELSAGPRFRVTVRYIEERRELRFESEGGEGRGDGETTLPRLGEGSIERVVWDHSSVGDEVRCRVMSGRTMRVAIGEAGVYRFSAMEILFGRFPAATLASLEAAVRPRRSR